MLSIVKIGWKPEDVVLLKRSKEDTKNVDHMMINHDIATVRECFVHDPKYGFFELSMGRLNWNGNRQPGYWIKNNRLYGVKVKLSYKGEGLERLFLQLFREKLTNFDKFPPLNYHKILNSLPFFFPLLEFQKKFPPINMSCLKSWSPPPPPLPPLQRVGRNYVFLTRP